ncbi:expressed protein [Phakopsora pachyrhizi]|uniref:Expressed protein n=1 Tax=Phakopsora pachyrhizi TaxID=170000 RepID=A0AAV0BH12_PHAPC|nr:expressed protein [Phakopsora pachyrhizi]
MDWMKSALALFQDQTKGQFKSQLAWEKLRYHPKWRVEKKDIILPSFDPPPFPPLDHMSFLNQASLELPPQ